MFLEIIAVVAPVILIIALGYLWARLKFPFDNDTIGSLVLRVGVPCLIFSNLTGADVDIAEIGLVAMAAVCVIAISTLVGIVVLKAARQPLHTYLMTAMNGNSGNMGLPLALMVFGPAGLPPAIAYFLVVSISQNTLGLVVTAGQFDPRKLLREPIILSSVATVLVVVFDLGIPQWIGRTTELLGGLVVPLMLMLLGASLSQFKVHYFGLSLGMSLMRFVAGATGALVVIWSFGLTGIEAGVVWIIATMPSAVVHFLMAERFARSPEKVAGVIVVSTLLTLAGLPAIVWVALRISGVG